MTRIREEEEVENKILFLLIKPRRLFRKPPCVLDARLPLLNCANVTLIHTARCQVRQ